MLYHIPESLVRAVIRVESDYVPTAVSRVGASGLMQLMPGTARGMGVTDVFDARQNIFGAPATCACWRISSRAISC